MDSRTEDCCNHDDAKAPLGYRTACWLRMPHPTTAVRSCLDTLPSVRVVRHGDFVHVLYHVDHWSAASVITREDVVARVRGKLFAAEMPGEVAIGHYICEGESTPRDDEELRAALRSS